MTDDPDSPDGDAQIDPKGFIKALAPDQLGVFEPLSGLMLLNISDADFSALGERWAANACTDVDVLMIRTINHEAYHFAQAAASGYVFHRQARAFMVFNASEPMPEPSPDSEMAEVIAAARAEAGDDPGMLQRVARMEAVLVGQERYALMEARAGAGDNSLMGALLPEYFQHQKALAEVERVPNADGLSITGVLEGSAVVHSATLMHGAEAGAAIMAELETLPPVYGELLVLTVAEAGERVAELLLPATALALRYPRPHNAYAPLLARLAESPRGEALEAGRVLAAALPEIADAGPAFGTAVELRAMHDGYRLYDPVLDRLRSGAWGIDSYDFLADPAAMHKVGSFPMGIVTADGYRGSLPKTELVARMAIMAMALRTVGRRRAEREFRQFQVDWAQDVLRRLVHRF